MVDVHDEYRPNIFHNLVCQLTLFAIAISQIVMQILAILLHFFPKLLLGAALVGA